MPFGNPQPSRRVFGTWEEERQAMEAKAIQALKVGVAVACVRGKHTPAGHACFVCPHVMENDPVHPKKIFWMPAGYYVCEWCRNYLDTHNSKLWHGIATECWECVVLAMQELQQRDPGLFVDYYTRKEK